MGKEDLWLLGFPHTWRFQGYLFITHEALVWTPLFSKSQHYLHFLIYWLPARPPAVLILPSPSTAPGSVLDYTDQSYKLWNLLWICVIQSGPSLLAVVSYQWSPHTLHFLLTFLTTTHLLAQLLSGHGLVKEVRKESTCIPQLIQYVWSSKYMLSIVQGAWGVTMNKNNKIPQISALLELTFQLGAQAINKSIRKDYMTDASDR